MKFHYILLLLPLLFACNTASKKTAADSSIIEGVKELVPVAPPPAVDPQAAQAQAQDTLFEDGTVPSSWSNAGFDDPEGFKAFILRFKSWVKNDQQDSIAMHIQFPLRQYKNIQAFKENYNNIFDAPMKTAVDTQRLDRIFRNAQGAMIGSGLIWFAPAQNSYRIIAINK